jgi:ATP-dependent DNA helicase UvrD/PcrA
MSAATDGLNTEQRRAAEAGDGPLLIVAGPGTGKTKTLAARIAHLVATGTPPERILALTFTKKAAEEMRGRVAALLKPSQRVAAHSPHISTFHSLCHQLLGDDLDFIAEPARLQLIRLLPKQTAFKGLSARELGLLISRAKNMAEDDPALQKLVRAYDAALAEQGLFDFDDLLVRARDLLYSDEAARQRFQSRFTHILVDEFQDTNRLQYELLQLMRGTDNLFVIGDPLQSIYGFRGAGGDIFDRFAADFPEATTITLIINYRSAPEIVNVANTLFAEAPNLVPSKADAGHVRAVLVLNEYSEAQWVLDDIQRRIGGGDMLRGVSDDDNSQHCTLQDFAIVYRNRAAAMAMQRAVEASGLPYQVVGEGSPYEKPQVQAIIALFRAAVQGEPPQLEGFTATQARTVQEMLGEAQASVPHALAEQIIALLGFEPTTALQQFVGTLVRFKTVEAAVRYFDDIAQANFYDPTADAITLLTIHASKGLEFPHVYLIGAEEGILPSLPKSSFTRGVLSGKPSPMPATPMSENMARLDEEKRLFYVAVTRARERLDVLYALKRGGESAEPSRFVTELSPKVLPRTTDPNLESDQRRAQKRAIKRSQQSLF